MMPLDKLTKCREKDHSKLSAERDVETSVSRSGIGARLV
jgi:hypothetical protein